MKDPEMTAILRRRINRQLEGEMGNDDTPAAPTEPTSLDKFRTAFAKTGNKTGEPGQVNPGTARNTDDLRQQENTARQRMRENYNRVFASIREGSTSWLSVMKEKWHGGVEAVAHYAVIALLMTLFGVIALSQAVMDWCVAPIRRNAKIITAAALPFAVLAMMLFVEKVHPESIILEPPMVFFILAALIFTLLFLLGTISFRKFTGWIRVNAGNIVGVPLALVFIAVVLLTLEITMSTKSLSERGVLDWIPSGDPAVARPAPTPPQPKGEPTGGTEAIQPLAQLPTTEPAELYEEGECGPIRHQYTNHPAPTRVGNTMKYHESVWCQYNFLLGELFYQEMVSGAQDGNGRTVLSLNGNTASFAGCSKELMTQAGATPLSRMCTALLKTYEGERREDLRLNAEGLPVITVDDLKRFVPEVQ